MENTSKIRASLYDIGGAVLVVTEGGQVLGSYPSEEEACVRAAVENIELTASAKADWDELRLTQRRFIT